MRSRLRDGLVYAGFLLLCFAVLDGVFGTFAGSASHPSFRIAHPYYHHGLRPQSSAETSWGGRRYPVRTNSLGFRDAGNEEVRRRPAGRRIVLIGDSMLEGLGVAYPDTAAGILAARGSARGIEVLNAAVVSYSPKLYELRTRWLVEHEGLELQRLVVFLDISDIQDEIHYEAFVPRAEIGWSEALLARWGRRSLTWQILERYAARRTEIDNRFRREADIDVWLRSVDAYRNPKGNPEAGRWEWTYDEAVYRAWGERGLALAETHMAALAAFCRERAIELVIVVYPSPYQILAKDLESRQVAYWQRFSEREGVIFVNLFPAFIDLPGSTPLSVYERYFIADDTHWNEAGNAWVADRVEEAVLGPGGP